MGTALELAGALEPAGTLEPAGAAEGKAELFGSWRAPKSVPSDFCAKPAMGVCNVAPPPAFPPITLEILGCIL